jgi:hypothetical protein
VLARLRRILILADPMPCELILGVLAVLWGVWLAWHGGTARYWSLFSPLFDIMPAPYWGPLYVILGIIQIWACLADCWRVQRSASLTAVAAWALISAGLCYSPTPPRTPSIYTTAFYAVLAGWCYFRVRGGQA